MENTLRLGSFEWMDEGKLLRDLNEKWPKAILNVFSGMFKGLNPKITQKIEEIISDITLSECTIKDIHNYMTWVCTQVDDIIRKSKFFTVKGRRYVLDNVQFRIFLHWIFQMLKKSWVDISDVIPEDVPDTLWKEIYNILRDKELTTLFIALKSYWLLEYSKNITNTFEVENELKILKVNKKSLEESLEELGAKKVFDGEIQDLYFDYPDKRFDADKKEERSFRIRRRKDKGKKSDYFYTLKRKQAAKKWRITRGANEKEYKIFGFDEFYKIIEYFGLKPYRAKVKQRVSYSINNEKEHIKFDIDTYEEIPTLVEIECDNEKTVKKYIELLWLSKNKQLRTGSRGLFKEYKKIDDYIFADNHNEKFGELVDKFKEKWGSISDQEAEAVAAE